MNSLRLVAVVMMCVALSACAPKPPSGAPNSLAVLAQSVPTLAENGNIDLFALRDIYLAQNPGRAGLPLYERQSRGFLLLQDGQTVRHGSLRSSGELFYSTSILSNENGVICMDRSGNWSGACFSASLSPEGRVRVEFKFGNGHGGRFVAADL